jgi:O-antigen/teichoic acid export membrane protein
MTDAYGVTVPAEKGRIVQKALGLVILVVLFWTGQLGLSQFFYFQYFILAFLGGVFIWVMKTNGHLLKQSWRLSQDRIKHYIREFYDYSHPLFVFSLVGLIVGIFDRWFLQFYGGSVEQGLYSLSYQIGAICFLFSSAMTPLLMREFSIAYGNNDLSQMASLFRRYIPLLYAITAYFACFIAIQADKVVSIIGGSQFHEAGLAVTIMAFYPIHQTYGQMTASVFYATGQTRLYRNIGMTFMLIGLPITYFLLAPTDKLGIDAGANGLAIKMVAINILGVNVQLYYNSKLLALKFWRYLGHQIVSVFALLIVAATTAFSIDYIIGTNNHIFVSFLLSGLFYTLIVLIMIYFSPILFGLKKADIQYVIQLCVEKLKD